MFSLKNNKLDDIGHWQNKDSEQYKTLLSAQCQNAIAQIKDMGLVYDAIQLARFSEANYWVWRPDQAETHPALLALCAFWQNFRNADERSHEARIPYIQLFLGKETYVPLISGSASMPIQIADQKLKNTIRESSVIFGDHFLVTFLASRRISASKSGKSDIVYYTVQDQPFLKENLLFSHQRMTISCQMLRGLYEFPKRFPSLWRYLKEQKELQEINEVNDDEIN